MSQGEQPARYFIDRDTLPVDYPTHAHNGQFWEELGRTIAVFGFLEEMLGKAIFALSGMKEFDPEADPGTFDEWIKMLEKALTGQLGALVLTYEKVLSENEMTKDIDYTALIQALKDATDIRNVLCHGSWDKPDRDGKTLPKFVNRKFAVFETRVDVDFLRATRKAVVNMTCDVLDSITSLGFQFPGSESPGKALWPKQMHPPKGSE